MLHHAFDVLGVDRFTPEGPFCFLLQAVKYHVAPVRAVAAVGFRRFAPDAPDRRNHTSVVSVVIVAGENIQFVVIFVLDSHIQGTHALPEELRHIGAPGFSAVGMAAPADVYVGQVVYGGPVLRFQYVGDTGAIASGGISENPVGSLPPGLLFGHALLFHFTAVFQHMFPDVVILVPFFKGGSHEYRFVQKFSGSRHGVPEEPGNTAGHIDAGALQFGERNRFNGPDPAAAALPEGTDAEKVQDFCDALAMAPHIGAGPEDDADIFGIVAFFRNEPLNDLVRQIFPDGPSRFGGEGSGVGAIKISARREQVCSSGTGSAGGGRLDVDSFQGIQSMGDFIRCFCQMGGNGMADIGADGRKGFLRFFCPLFGPGKGKNRGNGVVLEIRCPKDIDGFPGIIDYPVYEGGVGDAQGFIDVRTVF